MMQVSIPVRLVLVVLVLALNAFFAGAEASLVSVRKTRLEEMARQGQPGAKAALQLLSDPPRLWSVVQVGVTLSSLAMGWAGAEALYSILLRLTPDLPLEWADRTIHLTAFLMAFLIMTFAHVVAGEVLPKNLATEKADRVAVLVAPYLLIFYRLTRPFVTVIEGSAGRLSRRLGLRGVKHRAGLSAEEFRRIAEASRDEKLISEFEGGVIQRVLDFPGVVARQVMVPRNQMVTVPAEASLDEVLRLMLEHQYSRLPVHEGNSERIVGVLHYKDLVQHWMQRRRQAGAGSTPMFRLRNIMRPPLVVPETKSLDALLEDLRRTHSMMAIVVDEFGTVAGLVTLEDLVEQVFGEIEDEHDLQRPGPGVGARVLELDGTTTIRDLEAIYGVELPSGAGFETLAGFLLSRLHHLPSPGESIEYGGMRFTVTETARNRIARVRVERLPGS